MKRLVFILFLLLVFVSFNRKVVPTISTHRKVQKSQSGLFLLSPPAEKVVSLDYEAMRGFWILLDLRVFLASVLEQHPYFPMKVGDVIYRVFKVVSELNPYYFDVYYMASLNLMWDFKRYTDAEEVLKKAIKYRKDEWLWYFLLSFNYFYFMNKYDLAAEYMKEASKLKKSAFLASLASRLYYASGRTEIALSVLDNQIRNTRDENWKKELLKRKKALIGVLKIERAVEAFKRKEGRLPYNIEELVKKGYLKEVPKDPYGGRFYITKEGKVKSTSNFVEKK